MKFQAPDVCTNSTRIAPDTIKIHTHIWSIFMYRFHMYEPWSRAFTTVSMKWLIVKHCFCGALSVRSENWDRAEWRERQRKQWMVHIIFHFFHCISKQILAISQFHFSNRRIYGRFSNFNCNKIIILPDLWPQIVVTIIYFEWY